MSKKVGERVNEKVSRLIGGWINRTINLALSITQDMIQLCHNRLVKCMTHGHRDTH